MPKFLSVPREVDAIQFTNEDLNFSEVVVFCGTRKIDDGYVIQNFQRAGTYVNWDHENIVGEVWDQHHGSWLPVSVGDWIVRRRTGGFEVMHDRAFRATHNPISEISAKVEELPERAETHDDKTMTKVYDGIKEALGPFQDAVKVTDVISALQNRGILFRERS